MRTIAISCLTLLANLSSLPAECYDHYPDDCSYYHTTQLCNLRPCEKTFWGMYCPGGTESIVIPGQYDSGYENYYGQESFTEEVITCVNYRLCDTTTPCQVANGNKCASTLTPAFPPSSGILNITPKGEDCYYEY